ncbi:MAG: sugar phosphate isomerase/epimerase [Acidobacteria bacterium]|nr:sugar phosphate isomerase/epimerase [Acidobacteriota bacterium]
MKFALLSVSYSGLFYDGAALSIEQQIRKARAMGFDALAIETKRPVAFPLDLSRADRARIRALAADEGIALCAVESMSNFTSRHMEERENNLVMMRAILDLASDLGVDMVKVFAAWPGMINDEEAVAMYAPYERGSHYKRPYPPDLRRWQRAVGGIQEVAAWAADMGITLVLQNHAPVTAPGYEDTLAMIQEIDRPNVRMCLDVPLFYDRQDDAYVREAVRECRQVVAYTHYGAWNFREGAGGEPLQGPAPSFGGRINYEAFVDALAAIGYDGYLSSEYCVAVVRHHRIAGVEEVDRGTELALRYMKAVAERAVRAHGRPALSGVVA